MSAAAASDASGDERASGDSVLAGHSCAWVRERSLRLHLDLTKATIDLYQGKGGGGFG
jgi:hypothetical protein